MSWCLPYLRRCSANCGAVPKQAGLPQSARSAADCVHAACGTTASCLRSPAALHRAWRPLAQGRGARSPSSRRRTRPASCARSPSPSAGSCRGRDAPSVLDRRAALHRQRSAPCCSTPRRSAMISTAMCAAVPCAVSSNAIASATPPPGAGCTSLSAEMPGKNLKMSSNSASGDVTCGGWSARNCELLEHLAERTVSDHI